MYITSVIHCCLQTNSASVLSSVVHSKPCERVGGRCSPILQNVELPRDSPMAERLLESLDGLLTIEVS